MSPRMIAIGLLFLFAGALLMLAVALQSAPTPDLASPIPEAPRETLDPACAQWAALNPPQPGSKFGLALSTSTIDIELKVGETKEVMTITSAPSTGFNFCGYPYPPGSPDLIWSPWSGGLHPESSTTVTVTAVGRPGTYEGKVTIFDLDSGRSVDIPVKVVVR